MYKSRLDTHRIPENRHIAIELHKNTLIHPMGTRLHDTTVELRDAHFQLHRHTSIHPMGTRLHGTTVELIDAHS
jgi:hypothetical protein